MGRIKVDTLYQFIRDRVNETEPKEKPIDTKQEADIRAANVEQDKKVAKEVEASIKADVDKVETLIQGKPSVKEHIYVCPKCGLKYDSQITDHACGDKKEDDKNEAIAHCRKCGIIYDMAQTEDTQCPECKKKEEEGTDESCKKRKLREKFEVTDELLDKAIKTLEIPDSVDRAQLKRGMEIEQEHIDVTKDDPVVTAEIAVAHLSEIPDYYTRLDKMEAEAKKEMSTEVDESTSSWPIKDADAIVAKLLDANTKIGNYDTGLRGSGVLGVDFILTGGEDSAEIKRVADLVSSQLVATGWKEVGRKLSAMDGSVDFEFVGKNEGKVPDPTGPQGEKVKKMVEGAPKVGLEYAYGELEGEDYVLYDKDGSEVDRIDVMALVNSYLDEMGYTLQESILEIKDQLILSPDTIESKGYILDSSDEVVKEYGPDHFMLTAPDGTPAAVAKKLSEQEYQIVKTFERKVTEVAVTDIKPPKWLPQENLPYWQEALTTLGDKAMAASGQPNYGAIVAVYKNILKKKNISKVSEAYEQPAPYDLKQGEKLIAQKGEVVSVTAMRDPSGELVLKVENPKGLVWLTFDKPSEAEEAGWQIDESKRAQDARILDIAEKKVVFQYLSKKSVLESHEQQFMNDFLGIKVTPEEEKLVSAKFEGLLKHLEGLK